MNDTALSMPLTPLIIKNIKSDGKGLPLNVVMSLYSGHPENYSVATSIPPNGVREVVVSLPSDAARSFLIKVVTADGSQAVITVSRFR
ncbi:MAG: hypothetical protein J7L12_03445 [Desulfurococcales archaeon]|nr:hypothetical protein [Desulfurococcales archaeon]